MTAEIDLNALMLFHEVAAAGSLTNASARLGLSKSTVSRRIAGLERQIGALLLKRSTRKLAVTDIGAALCEHCARIAGELSRVREEAAAMQSGLTGTLRVSMPAEFGISWLGKAVGDFASHYPEVRLEITVHSGAVDLISQPYDVAIHLGHLSPSRMAYRRLATLTRGVYASPAYLRQSGAPRSIEDIRNHACVVTELQRQEGVWSLREEARRRRVEVTGRVTVNNIGLARELVLSGAGLGILPNILCRNDVRTGRLTRVLPTWESPALHAAALIPSRDKMPRKTRVFLDFIAARLAAEPSEPTSPRQ